MCVAFSFVNPRSPPVCPSCQGHNTIPQGLNIISQFFRFSAPVINFRGLLYKALCNVFCWPLFFCTLLSNGSGGRFSVAETAVDIHMRMKGAPPAPLLLLGSVCNKPKQANGRLGWRDHCDCAHVSLKFWRKQGTRAVCQLLHSLNILFLNIICFVVACITKGRESNDSHAIWLNIFEIWICIVCLFCL